MPQRPSRGIVDWESKRQAIDVLFSCYTNKDTASAILGPGASFDEVETLAQSLKSWKKSDPIGATGRIFISKLQDKLREIGCTAPNLEAVIKRGSYRDFIHLLPEEKRNGLPRIEEPIIVQQVQNAKQAFHQMWIPWDEPSEKTRSAYQNGRIDQKFHYLSPDASESWRAVVNSGAYHQYHECYASLEHLCKEALWQDFYNRDDVDGAVMLGGGAPSKDLLIISSIAAQPLKRPTLHYTIVDFSMYMLSQSFHMIDSALRSRGGGARDQVAMHLLKTDFFRIAGAGTQLRRPGKRVAWLIPGGTIGNLNERHFFQAVGREAQDGDMLVVGAETLGSGDVDTIREILRRKYNTPEIKRFVETPLHAVWRELNSELDMKDAMKQLTVDVVDGEDYGHSVIRGSLTVEVSLSLPKQQIVLLTSTRYQEASFIDFAARSGFVHQMSVASPLNPNYKQMVFSYKAKLAGGGSQASSL